MSERNTSNTVDGITLVTEPAAASLNERQLVDYRAQRRDCLEWLLALGKAPEKGKGYARGTVKPRSHRMDMFYRWLWDRKDGYTADIRPDHADAWMRALATEETSRAHKANCQKAVQMLLKWRHHAHGIDAWDPDIRFSDNSGTTTPRDYLTRDERSRVREAALEYGTIPAYNDLSPEQRDRWKAHLAQRFEKPKKEVIPGRFPLTRLRTGTCPLSTETRVARATGRGRASAGRERHPSCSAAHHH